MEKATASLLQSDLNNDFNIKEEIDGSTQKELNDDRETDVAIICQFFTPEYVTSARLSWDTAKYLADSGLKVKAVCGYPGEYHTEGSVLMQETLGGVHIRRLRYLQLKRNSRIGRLINYFSFTASVISHIGVFRHCKTVMVYSNPPVLPVAAVLASILYGCKIVFVSHDVYPEIAYASGSLSPSGVIARVMRRINRSLFKRASAVVALTDEMREYLLRNRPELSEDKVFTISNWAHEDPPAQEDNARAEFGFSDDDFVVSYFGNMGICQDETALIRAMELLKDHPHIRFLIAGHGSKMPLVRQTAERLPNVKICGFLTGEDFDKALAASSCGIVSLDDGLLGMCAPSKYYTYLQAGIPVISITEPESYLNREITGYRIGTGVTVGNGEALSAAIRSMAEEPEICRVMSLRARELYRQEYDEAVGLEKYRTVIERLIVSAEELVLQQ